jgi:hypothetical protein
MAGCLQQYDTIAYVPSRFATNIAHAFLCFISASLSNSVSQTVAIYGSENVKSPRKFRVQTAADLLFKKSCQMSQLQSFSKSHIPLVSAVSLSLQTAHSNASLYLLMVFRCTENVEQKECQIQDHFHTTLFFNPTATEVGGKQFLEQPTARLVGEGCSKCYTGSCTAMNFLFILWTYVSWENNTKADLKPICYGDVE